jgi:WD40 repeat protein
MRPWLCAALLSVALVLPTVAVAQPAPFCQADETPSFQYGFATLAEQLGPTMGDPVECAHVDAASGDTLQETTMGLARYRAIRNVPTFSAGLERWGLTEDGLVTWSGERLDPPVRPLAAFVGDNDSTWLRYPDGTLTSLSVYPTPSAVLARVALDPWARTVATTRVVDSSTEIVLLDVASGESRSLPDTQARNCRAPAFHPNGTHLVAVCQPPSELGGNKQQVDLFNLKTGFERTITIDPGGLDADRLGILDRPLISPDGKTMLLQGSIDDGVIRLWKADMDTGVTAPFMVQGFEDCVEGCFDEVRPIAFHSDGRVLASTCRSCANPLSDDGDPTPQPEPLQSEVVLLNLDGSVGEVLYSSPELVLFPALSPDGQTLLFTTYPQSESSTVAMLFSFNRASGETTEVARGRSASFAQPSGG